jgi:hypothetical protein
MTYAFASDPSAGLDDLPSLIRWFLKNDRLLPNNLAILEEAHGVLHGSEDGCAYARHLARVHPGSPSEGCKGKWRG